MRVKLEEYLQLCEQYQLLYRQAGYEYSEACRRVDHEAQIRQPTVSRILGRLDPALAKGFKGLGYTTGDPDRRVRQGLGLLNDRQDLEVRLALDSPSLAADRLHAVVWAGAAVVWSTASYRVAVGQAAVALSAHIKARVGSHLNERELVSQVFSPEDPRPGQARLHHPGNKKDKSWRSRQEGLHLIAQGAFAGIRNPAAHDVIEWSEQEGLEHLAVLSVVARWADEAIVVTAPDTVNPPGIG
ncbi:MAG TPA: hypothetical protein DEH05_16470 [Propionibacteriaceae bacterium]|nr:hypothetical protein [Propionibacteriaceae bacterium]